MFTSFFTSVCVCVCVLCRSFSEADLGKMKTVLPDAFLFSQQKGLDHCHTSKYRLVIAPNSLGWGSDCLQRGGGVLGPAGLVQRRKLFRKALVDIVKGHHSVRLHSGLKDFFS